MNGEVKELSWVDVDDWAAKGGSKLGAPGSLPWPSLSW